MNKQNFQSEKSKKKTHTAKYANSGVWCLYTARKEEEKEERKRRERRKRERRKRERMKIKEKNEKRRNKKEK